MIQGKLDKTLGKSLIPFVYSFLEGGEMGGKTAPKNEEKTTHTAVQTLEVLGSVVVCRL